MLTEIVFEIVFATISCYCQSESNTPDKRKCLLPAAQCKCTRYR